MTYYQLMSLIISAQNCDTPEQFVVECAGSYPGGGACDNGAVADKLKIIYSLRDGLAMRDVVKLSGMSIASFSRHYKIPRRSVENWVADSDCAREPPQYLTLLLLSDLLSWQL